MKVSDYVMRFLERKGISHLFTLPGGGCCHLIDSLGKSKIEPVFMLHEQGAGIAADAYAQIKGFGAALVTTGPGVTNIMTAVAAAYMDSTPLMVIAGQVQLKDMAGGIGPRQNGFQEVPGVSLMKPITKYAICVKDPRELINILETAYHKATKGRQGPVYIEIPLDVQAARSGYSEIRPIISQTPCENLLTSKVKFVLSKLRKAERPIFLIGNGCRKYGKKNLANFLRIFDIPIMTTWRAVDLVEARHNRFVGKPGIAGNRAANLAQESADLIICIGCRLDHGQTAYNPDGFAAEAKRIIVDIDFRELEKFRYSSRHNVDLLITSSAEDFMDKMVELSNYKFGHSEALKDWFKKLKKWCWDFQAEGQGKLYSLAQRLSDELNSSDTLVLGSSGLVAEVIMQKYSNWSGARVLNSPGLGSMGFAIPAAIGAALATGKQVVCVDGDGSFPMNAQELEVVRRLELPITFIVYNNGGYESIRNTQNKHFEGRLVGSSPGSGLTIPSAWRVASGYGIPSYLSNNPNFHNTLPVVFEIITNEDVVIEPKVEAIKNFDGSFKASGMACMSPEVELKDD